MKRLEQIQFGTLLLAVACIAINWRAGFWATVAFAFVSLLRLKGSNPALEPQTRRGLWAIVGYWLLLLFSLVYTDDIASGWNLIAIKASILFFPLAFLLTDTSYLTSKHLRIIGYTLVAALLIMFFYCIGVSTVKLANGASLKEVTDFSFDPRHHAYTALYLTVALVFIYFELVIYWHSLPRWVRRALLGAVPLLIIYIILVNSRSGLLTLYSIELFFVLHYALTRHNWPRAILLAVLLGGFSVGMEVVIPGHDERLVNTISDLSSDGILVDTENDSYSDVRLMIYKCGIETWLESPVFGHGVGDYQQKLLERFNANNFSGGVESQLNAHNQYIETLLSTGLIGLAVLLFWMLWPTIQAWRTSRRDVFWLIAMFTFCFMLGCLFESMLERQMGVLFIGALMAVMTLTVAFTSKENKQLKSNRYE